LWLLAEKNLNNIRGLISSRQLNQNIFKMLSRLFHASRALLGPGKRIPFLLADIGEGITEVQLLQW